MLPFVLMGLGALVIGAGGWYFFAGHRQLETLPERDFFALTQVNERIEFAGEPDESLFMTSEHEYPDLPDEAVQAEETQDYTPTDDPHSQVTAAHERPDLPEETAEFYDNQTDDEDFDESEEWDEEDYADDDEWDEDQEQA